MITTKANSSLGELIRHHRKQAEMTLVQLEKLTDVDKASISRIESGQVKRPSLVNIQKIGCILKISSEEIIERYIEVEERDEVLFTIFDKLIQGEKNISIISNVAMKVLQSPVVDSIELVKRLYEKVTIIEKPSIKLALFQLIINYSRAHGIMPYIAKSMLQVYLIERDDFSKFRSTYVSGKGILFFEDFLSSEERGLMYYKLGVHAYYLCIFEESVDLGRKALDAEISDNRMRANTIYFVCNCYYYLGDYEQTKKYLTLYNEYSLPEVKDNTKLIEAALHSANGKHQLAISVLQENLPYCGDDTLLHVVNLLIILHLQTKNLSEIEMLFHLERRLLSIPCVTPFLQAELAHYYKLRGDYYIVTERIEEGINCYLEAAAGYAKVDLIAKESDCLRLILNIHTNKKETMDVSTIEKLETYHNYKVKTSNL
ncbi:helix-turn-helix domain-containing protein [Chengkuizengella sediminis]|uniref:helix-turn-helix domain-containing protein n=1 Tax=Chengkuizengella sediminis TaxID=1885917 RepID=UPI001389ECDA|nr:helix-turn-helix transcriptional regulator [Chengkuizengella sediminis]NDI36443.1 helix-turn-helix transcriptional regulator [Chengkuizengella sediminis]